MSAHNNTPLTDEQKELAAQWFRLCYWAIGKVKERTGIYEVHDDDLVDVAQQVLIKCARQFDASRGVLFKSYAANSMLKALHERVLNRRDIHLPRTTLSWVTKYRHWSERNFGSVVDFVNTLDIKEKNRPKLVLRIQNAYSILHNESTEYDYKNHYKEDRDNSEENKEEVRAALRVLDEREAYIIKRRFYDDKTLYEVGYELNLTRERVRQIEKAALEKMREVA